MQPERIFLIGPRGSGKSTIGQSLALRLFWQFEDTDELIEHTVGKSVAAIFADGGETAFRDHEREALRQAASARDAVIATGGGAILRADNREILKSGFVVLLTAEPTTIHERLISDPMTPIRRPSLTAEGGLQEIVDLLIARGPLYREAANLTINTTSLSPEQVVSAILAECGKC